jgi:hypothetical protein
VQLDKGRHTGCLSEAAADRIQVSRAAAVRKELTPIHVLLMTSTGALMHCCRAAVASFLEDEGTKRLLVYIDGKDLGAVSGMADNWLCLSLQRITLIFLAPQSTSSGSATLSGAVCSSPHLPAHVPCSGVRTSVYQGTGAAYAVIFLPCRV